MKKRTLGRTGLQVSELCLGTHSFGWKTSLETSYALLDAYRAAGGNFIQASAVCPDFPMTSDWQGLPEAHVGQWMNDRTVRRGDLVIATRLALCRPVSDSRSISRLIRAACEGSLRRLGIGHLDLLLIEWNEALLPIEEVFGTIGMLVRAGMLRYGAVSGFPSWRVADLIGLSKRADIARPEAMQVEYSLLRRGTAEIEARDVAREYRLGLLARAPLAHGRLAEPLAGQAVAPAGDNVGRVLDALYFAARERGVSAAQIALGWVLAAPEVTSVLLRPRTPAHLTDALKAAELELTPNELAMLDDVSLPPSDLLPVVPASTAAFPCSPVTQLGDGCRIPELINS